MIRLLIIWVALVVVVMAADFFWFRKRCRDNDRKLEAVMNGTVGGNE